MKLREFIEEIEQIEECSRANAIYTMLTDDVSVNHGYNEIIYEIPYVEEYVLKTKKRISKIARLKLKNKFERRLIKIAEGSR